ncbi:ATP12 family protein [Sandarakinorhabdus sp.]|uniref:ATP12 family chaperone protein n=1 Tax=Sandarakinorhabdus sp. TaxID=1916663 RepID=UPI00333F64BB
MKRFWKTASVTTGDHDWGHDWGVALDGKPLRTPARAPLAVPTLALADAIAAEWNAQGDIVNPRSLPMTGLANAAIDRVAPDVTGFADGLAVFAENELLAYRAGHPAPLVAQQAAGWDPWLAWAQTRHGLEFTLVTGIIHQPQPPATLARVAAAYRSFDVFRLAALNPVVTISGSALIGLAVADGAMDAATAWAIGHLDELWQAEQWGKDPLAEAGHAERQADLAAAVRCLALL